MLIRRAFAFVYLGVLEGPVGVDGGDLAEVLGQVAVEAGRGIQHVLDVLVDALDFPLKARMRPDQRPRRKKPSAGDPRDDSPS